MLRRSRTRRRQTSRREAWNPSSQPLGGTPLAERRDYDVDHYLRVLRDSYAERLRVVFEPEDFLQLFRLDAQRGLFDRPVEEMRLRWIRCTSTTERARL